LPVGVLPELVTVMVVEPEVVTVAGLKEALAPEGNPLAAKLTEPVKPVADATVTVYEVLFPGDTLCEEGEADRANPEVTVTFTVAGLGLVTPKLSVTVSDAV